MPTDARSTENPSTRNRYRSVLAIPNKWYARSSQEKAKASPIAPPTALAEESLAKMSPHSERGALAQRYQGIIELGTAMKTPKSRAAPYPAQMFLVEAKRRMGSEARRNPPARNGREGAMRWAKRPKARAATV